MPHWIYDSNRSQILHFDVVVFERLWLERNRVRLGNPCPDWTEFAQRINTTYIPDWFAAQKRIKGREHARSYCVIFINCRHNIFVIFFSFKFNY